MIGSDLDWSVLDRYLSDRCSPEEAEAVRQWAASNPSHASLLLSVRKIWDEARLMSKRFDAEVAVRALRTAKAINERGTSIRLVRRGAAVRPVMRRVQYRMSVLAAAGLFITALSIGMWHWSTRWLGRETQKISMREYATAPGQRADVLLTDGTRVSLGVDSRLRVPTDYGARVRTVGLEGEAYFEVQHDEHRPFSVHTEGAVAEDLGTKFLVRAYPGDNAKAMVVVAEGSVALGPEATRTERSVVLTPGQQGELNSSGVVTVTPDVDVEMYLAWRNGRLELRRVPLSRAIRDLERWYGISITLSDTSLAQISVTASFGSESVDTALGILSRTLGIRYARRGTSIYLVSDRTP